MDLETRETCCLIENKNNTKATREYQVSRGYMTTVNELQLFRIKFLAADGKLKELEDMVKPIRLSWSYKGVLHTVRFQCDRNINLTKVGFWGPASSEAEEYLVRLVVSSGDCYSDKEVKLADFTSAVVARPKEDFYVQVPKGVEIRAGVDYNIKFQLDGPNTCVGSLMEPRVECKDSGVCFQFYDGSNQLCRLGYTLQAKP